MSVIDTTIPPATTSKPAGRGVLRRLFDPVAIDFLVYFRLAFGAIMLWEMVRYIEAGWVQQNFIDPPLHFTFFGFSWVRPWPGDGMHWHFYAMTALAACITVGLCYRAAALLFCLGFTHIFLIDQAYYLNHFYLVCLISFVAIFLPAHRAFSLDAWLRPALRSAVAPAWTLWILRALVGITYFYGAIAKANWDWLTGNPMRQMLASADTFPLLGRLFHLEPVILFYAWGGLLLDLLIVPALTWKRTRNLALLTAAFFHLSNDQMFQIGIFPWFMLTATLLLWPPKKLEPLWLSQTVLGAMYVYACVAMMNVPWGDDFAVRLAALLLSAGCLPLMLWKPPRLPAFLAAAAWILLGPRLLGAGGLPATLVSIMPGLIVWGAIAAFPPDFLRGFRLVEPSGEGDGAPRGVAGAGVFTKPRRTEDPAFTTNLRSVPVQPRPPSSGSEVTRSPLTFSQKLTLAGLALFLAVQCLAPFRHWLYPGSVHWTEEGHLFSWHMKLRYKNGRAAFLVSSADGQPLTAVLADGYLLGKADATGRLTHLLDGHGNPRYALTLQGERVVALEDAGVPAFELGPGGWPIYELDRQGNRLYGLDSLGERIYELDAEDRPIIKRDGAGQPIPPRESPYYLNRRQRLKMPERPEMLLQYAHFLADRLEEQGYENVAVRADVFCSLNGREEQRLIDPDVDLAQIERTLGPVDWILPLDPTLKPGVLYQREVMQGDDQD